MNHANHVVIWKADEHLAEKLVEGIETNRHTPGGPEASQHPPLHIVCAKGQRKAFKVPSAPTDEEEVICYDIPSPSTDVEAWGQVIQSVYDTISRKSGTNVGTRQLVLHFVVSAAHCGNAYALLRALLRGAAKVASHVKEVARIDYEVILLEERSSAHAAQQTDFLQSLKQDAEQQSEDCPWNRLTVLSSWNRVDSSNPKIAEVRADFLYGVICEANPPQGHYECLTYEVRQSNFSRKDVQDLPKQMLYEKIRDHQEDGADAEKAFKLDLDAVAALIPMEKAKPIVVSALLADDDNYEKRTGDTLLEEFCKLNAEAFLPHAEVQQLADQWLVHAKRQLAHWIDVDSSIRKSIKPGEYQETRIDTEIACLDTPPQPCTKVLHFGHKVPLRQRRKAAGDVAELFVDHVIRKAMIEYLEALKARLPLLSDYLAEMDKANLAYFGPQTDLVEAFQADEWSQKIDEELETFDMELISMSDDMVDDYTNWLKESLQDRFFSNLSQHQDQNQTKMRQNAEDSFISKATLYAKNDKDAYVMLNSRFTLAQDQQLDWQITCLGASTRLYLLNPIRWDIKNSDIPSAFMTRVEMAAAAAEQKVQHFALTENQGTEVDMSIKLEQTGSVCTLSWHWPKNTSSLKLTVKDKSKTYEAYSKKIQKPKSGNKSTEELPTKCLPFGDRVCIRLEASNKIYSEKEFQLSQVKENVYSTPARRWLWSPMSRHYVDITQQAKHETTQGCYALELHLDHHVFKYPIPADKDQMIMLREANHEWQSMQLVLEGK